MEYVATKENGHVRDLTEGQAWELFDNAAEFFLQIDGKEFIRRWESGYYDDNPDDPDVVDVATLLPLVR